MFNEYLFHLCDCTCLNVMCVCSIAWWSNPKRFKSILFVFWSDFCHFWCWKFFLKCQILCCKTLCLAISWLLSWLVPSREIFKEFRFLKNFKQRVFLSPSRVVHNSDLACKILPCTSAHFASRLAIGSWVTDSWNVEKYSF